MKKNKNVICVAADTPTALPVHIKIADDPLDNQEVSDELDDINNELENNISGIENLFTICYIISTSQYLKHLTLNLYINHYTKTIFI